MIWFLGGILLLIVGYFTYGRWVESVLQPDDRPTPALAEADGVDTLPLAQWKNMLIQLLNIAGVGPVIGVILGIKFGWICFWIIPLGCILGGAVHDFVAGFMSVRHHGGNLPALTRQTLGSRFATCYSLFIVVLLLLVVAVFINIPASLTEQLIAPEKGVNFSVFWACAGAIFLYYICATLFPVDKIIGRVYPIFGAILLLGSLAVFAVLCWEAFADPTLLTETEGFKAGMFKDQPVIPCLFVTIACGIISGFHATQSPIVARTMVSERQARATYYGMMILEGIIAMIWAGAGMAIYNLFPSLMAGNPTVALVECTKHFLGGWMGIVTILSVIVLAITSGDTALRSLRLALAEITHLSQSKFLSRLLLCLPLILLTSGILWWSNQSAETFNWLWKYFAWGNQVLSSCTLMVVTVWLLQCGKQPWMTFIPGLFMIFIVTSFILWADPSHAGCPYGFNLPLSIAYAIAGLFTLICGGIVLRLGYRNRL